MACAADRRLRAAIGFAIRILQRTSSFEIGRRAELGIKKFMSGEQPGLGEPEIRAKISRAWNTSHIRECMRNFGDVMSALWGECDDASGMHFCAQRHVAVELVDPVTGARVPWREGAEGEPVYTTFDREATPTLRYRSADHVVVLGTACRCGRTAPKIRCIGPHGRHADLQGHERLPQRHTGRGAEQVLRRRGAPYMRTWKQREDQVRFDSPIAFADQGTPARASRHRGFAGVSCGHRERKSAGRLQIRVEVAVVEPADHPAHRLQDRARPVG